jgi:predicted HTH transcriptional regulator
MEIEDPFLTPRSRYYGEFTPQNLLFNADLQEFSERVSIICALETGGKITPLQAYEQIKGLWKQLKEAKNEILDNPEFQKPVDPPHNPS